jgi:riboflavin synthase
MFSGIVESIGVINCLEVSHDCIYMTMTPKILFDDISIGDSISVNGVCLTVTSLNQCSFDVTAVPETLRVTNLRDLSVGSLVNLERSLPAGGRIGGHYVQGHVDGLGVISDIQSEGRNVLLVKISVDRSLAKYMVNKGYVAIDGMSITIIQSAPDWFSVTLIPHTQSVSIVKDYKVGTKVNIEVDIMGKYIEKLLMVHSS